MLFGDARSTFHRRFIFINTNFCSISICHIFFRHSLMLQIRMDTLTHLKVQILCSRTPIGQLKRSSNIATTKRGTKINQRTNGRLANNRTSSSLRSNAYSLRMRVLNLNVNRILVSYLFVISNTKIKKKFDFFL
jgi:hypothetical protein